MLSDSDQYWTRIHHKCREYSCILLLDTIRRKQYCLLLIMSRQEKTEHISDKYWNLTFAFYFDDHNKNTDTERAEEEFNKCWTFISVSICRNIGVTFFSSVTVHLFRKSITLLLTFRCKFMLRAHFNSEASVSFSEDIMNK